MLGETPGEAKFVIKWTRLLAGLISAALLGSSCWALTNKPQSEQLRFSTEMDLLPIKRPVVLSERVIQVLRKDELLLETSKACLEAGGSSGQISPSWFVGSQVHLNSQSEIDLIVVAKEPCLNGANVGPFWAIRQRSGVSEIVLSAVGHDMSVLDNRTNGLRDIQVDSFAASLRSTSFYKFDGKHYRRDKSESKPIGD